MTTVDAQSPAGITPAARLRRDQVHFYYDAKQEPVVTITSGDTIIFETEDANRGTIRKETDAYASLDDILDKLGGANPVTGPVYVDGARPGDCLAVTIKSMAMAPVWGHGYTSLIPGLGGLVSNYSLQPPLPPKVVISRIEGTTVHLPAKGKTLEIPAHPFLGTIGVAPKGARQLSLLQGKDFLGNCDIPEVCPGNTVVLPVNVEGALLSLGDAHAAQGDGEICGVAIEIQADVEVTVSVIPKGEGDFAGLPQVNSSAWIGSLAALGGVNLGDTVRAAYIDLIQRLVRFYGFTLEDAYVLASNAMRVRIGQVVDPLYSALVTIDRRYLE